MRQRIYKTEIRVGIGMTVERRDEHGDAQWLKGDTALTVHVGPGFPDDEMLEDMLAAQLQVAVRSCMSQISVLSDAARSEVV